MVYLNWHMIVNFDNHGKSLGSFEVDLLEFSQQIGSLLLVNGGVDDEEGNHGLRPKSRKHVLINTMTITKDKYLLLKFQKKTYFQLSQMSLLNGQFISLTCCQ